ncbi:MAG: alpha/beta fold hydrolase [Halieaceae bacterium]|nr:alpha/beta fold hydrolase [Halieaceae bacterium]
MQFEEGVRGKLVLPDAHRTVSKAVLMLHGMNGSMDEVGNLFADLADALAARGIASLRFNFSGEGERVDYLMTSTQQSRLVESRAAFELLRREVPDASYGVLGFSLGGLTAMEAVGQQPDRFKSMVLWSAVQEMRMQGSPAMSAAAREAAQEGRGSYRSYAEITLTREFVLSYIGVDASRALSTYSGALLTIRGDADYLPSHDRDWLRRAPGRDKSFLLIGGADHIFNVLEQPRPNYGARVIDATADWFQRTLQ